MSFVHLHCHSHYTLLESPVQVPALVQAAATAEMPAVALTDRGNVLGALEFQVAAGKAGIKPIIGCQVNIAPLGMRERSPDMLQLVLLASSRQGYFNLVRLVSQGWLEGYYYEPRVDLEAIAALADDLVCLTGCGGDGFLNRHLLVGASGEAERQAGLLSEIFPNRLWIELADHGVDGPVNARGEATALARRLDLPVVATNHVHYLHARDAAIHDVQLAVRKVTTLNDPRRRRMASNEYWFKSAEMMRSLFADQPEACDATLEIAEICAGAHIPTGTYHLPTFVCPNDQDENLYLETLCRSGIQRRYGENPGTDIEERLRFELATIVKMGFAAYFLIVQDFINWAKERGIPVGPGRGSAAGSIVAYALGITDICPLRYGLLFERFLNPDRISMPDIDIDFCQDRRGEVIDYVAAKYGRDAVTQIMTMGKMKARMAIKDVARAYEWSPEEAQDLANLVPEDPSGKHTIPVCLGLSKLKGGDFDPSEKMVARYQGDERAKQLLDTAMALEGLGRSLGVHACGVIIAPGPVHHFVPVCTVKGKPATQYNMSQCEDCGLLKMDFLGLKTMSILQKAAQIASHNGPTVDFLSAPLDDPTTFRLLGEGDTLGVFQCESSGFRELIRRLKPDRFEDMIALVALYRPGPLGANMHIDYVERKHGRQRVEYPHPVLEEILKETFGLYIYQEQVMNISRELCGFTPGEADTLRKAMGKKLLEVLDKLREKFVTGAWERHRFPQADCEAMWNNILNFASYGFNKSHSACYGLIAYWTAWMKANHYPAFMTANLIYEMGNKDKMTLFTQELRAKGVPVLPPDVNESGWEFTWTGEAVRFGFGGVKNVGEGAAQHLIEVRQSGGHFVSLFDLCERVDSRTINKRVVEALVGVGAFDSLHPNRRAVAETVPRAYERGHRVAKTRAESQNTLFDVFEQDEAFLAQSQGYAEVPDWDEGERLRLEKELTGYWMSSHPLTQHLDTLARHASHVSRDLAERPEGDICIAAVIVSKRERKTRRGQAMAVLQLEDLHGRFEAVLFPGRSNRRGDYEPGAAERFTSECEADLIALFRGQVDQRRKQRALPPSRIEAEADGVIDPEASTELAEDQHEQEELPSLIVSDIVPLHLITERLTREITLHIDANNATDAQVEHSTRLLAEHNGDCPVKILVQTPQDVLLTLLIGDRFRVHPTTALLNELRTIWGKEAVTTLC